MIIEKNRHMEELIRLLDATAPLTAEELATEVDSSVRTVKSDIKYLNDELEATEGCRILSHKGKGYSICILDEEKTAQLRHRLEVYQALFGYRSILETNRWLFIAQTLLSCRKIKKEMICETLYLSESGIAPSLNRACEFLESFGITIHSNATNGLFIDGKEQDIRSCLVELASSSYHDIELIYSVPEFEEMIYPNLETYNDIRHAFLKILRESKMSVTDISSKKLATHLCLIRKRSQLGYHPEIRPGLTKEIKETYEYSLTEKIFSDPEICEYLGTQEESEYVNFARLLIINRDIDLQSDRDIETILPRYIIANQGVSREVFRYMRTKSPYISVFSMEIMQRYETDMESLFLQIYLKNYFDRLSKERLVTYVEMEEQLISPLSKDIARIMIERLELYFGQRIQILETQSLAGLVELILKNIHYQYRKLKLAVVSMQGRVVGKNMAQNLMDSYGEYIASEDIFDLYEMRRINFEDYDAIILHGSSALYMSYPCKFIAYEILDEGTENASEKLFDDLFVDGYSKNVINTMKQKMNVYHSTAVESLQAFITLISYKYAKSDEDRQYLYRHLMEREYIFSYVYSNGIGVVFLDYDHVKKDHFDIYVLEHPITERNEVMIRYMIVLCFDPSERSRGIKEFNAILQMEISSKESLQKLIDNPDELMTTWQTVLKKQFLNGN